MSSPPASRQLVATLGPSSWSCADQIAAAGATHLRVNGSHMTAEELDAALARLRESLPGIPVVVDLQGAKMRLGRFPARVVREGDTLRFEVVPGDPQAIPLPHPELIRSVRPGETLRCDDNRLRLRVTRADAATGELEAVALCSAMLGPRKGVNVVEHPVDLDDLAAVDAAQIEAGLRYARVGFACSFLKDGSELAWIRARAPHAFVIAKIERAEAIDNLPSIAALADELWVCRGDLGSQVGAARLAQWLHGFRPSTIQVPTLLAGQVFEHLTHHAEPTRSEVCHLYDILARGYRGLVLSDETAIGVDPVRAAATASALLVELARQLASDGSALAR